MVGGAALHVPVRTSPGARASRPRAISPGARASRPRATPPYGQPPVVALPLAYPNGEQLALPNKAQSSPGSARRARWRSRS